MSVAIVAGYGPSLINFRGHLIRSLVSKGYDVLACAPELTGSDWSDRVRDLGARAETIPLKRARIGLDSDMRSIWHVRELLQRNNTQVVLAYTVKPVLVACAAAWATPGVRAYAWITGLGYSFRGATAWEQAVRRVVSALYRVALQRANAVLFQNRDDEQEFRARGALPNKARTHVINGSGVDLNQFAVVPLPAVPVFIMIARLLWDKGIGEFVAAAKEVRARYPTVRCLVLGALDDNPQSISEQQLAEWVEARHIEFLGWREDVRPAIAEASVMVLPSYREGTPRSVLEAMAMGRAIITTDAPGCRETVEPERSGLLVPVGDASALATAMIRFVDDPSLAARMGARSRMLAVERYDVREVTADLLRIMELS